jgi:hypothetical protein
VKIYLQGIRPCPAIERGLSAKLFYMAKLTRDDYFQKYRMVMIKAKSDLDKSDYSVLLEEVESDIEDENEFLKFEEEEEE